MLTSVPLLLLTMLVAAQTPSNSDAKPDDQCSMSGRVVNSVTGEPLRRVTIVLMRADGTPGQPPLAYSTVSSAEGVFTMKDLEPGKYRLTAMRNGYVSFVYGATSPQRPGTTISLVRQQNLSDLTLKMTPHAVIVGRILDEEGEPVPNVSVTLQAYHYLQGRRQLTTAGGAASTNDLGEYRMFGVHPGKYYLTVTPTNRAPGFALDRTITSGPEADYVTTYYPGSFDPAAAAQLEVPAGRELRGMGMVLSKTRTVRVKGRVIHGMPGRPNVTVMISPRAMSGFVGMLRNTPLDAAGNFEIRNVTPGSYVVTAMLNDGTTSRIGRIPVEVGNSNLEGLNVVIGPGLSIPGRVRSDPDAPPVDLTNVRFTLQVREAISMMFSGVGPARIDPDGAFEFKNVPPERYNLAAHSLPSGAYIKSARSDQVDVLASGLDATAGAVAPLDIVISPRAATVTGTVQNTKTNNPAPGATVVLIPQEPHRRDQQSFYRMVNADQNGAFSIPGIPPGEYRAYAWEDIDPGAYMDPEFLKPVEGKGEALTIREGEQKSVTLKLIPIDAN
jgi:hypothetical protein